MAGKTNPTGAVKELLSSVEKHTGVVGVIVFENDSAQVIFTSLPDRTVATVYARTARKLCRVADKGLQELSERDETKLIRLRTAEYELVIKPEESFTLVVLQDPAASVSKS